MKIRLWNERDKENKLRQREGNKIFIRNVKNEFFNGKNPKKKKKLSKDRKVYL